MNTEWVTIEEFPNYMINEYGEIMKKSNGQMMRPNQTMQGTLKVGFSADGKQHTRSVKVLVAEAFVPGKDDIFDTPIHLDGNPLNVRADNLTWRPRWFAWKYSRQMEKPLEIDKLGPIRDVDTGYVYQDVYTAGVMNGLLFRDIRKSMVMKDSAFPTFQAFEMA